MIGKEGRVLLLAERAIGAGGRDFGVWLRPVILLVGMPSGGHQKLLVGSGHASPHPTTGSGQLSTT